MSEWRPVVLSADCDADGNCPACRVDYADCPCPGPTQDDLYEYQIIDGTLYARLYIQPHPATQARVRQ